MQIEIRNLGVAGTAQLEEAAVRTFGAALDRFADRIRRVRVRVLPAGTYEAACRVRVWCGDGPTVVVEAQAASGNEAIHAVADRLSQALRRRWSTRRSRHRHGAARRLPTSSTSHEELSRKTLQSIL